MNVQFFNTLSGEKEPFKPLQAGRVKMYSCGPTVYDLAHIGNFRSFVFADLIKRLLEYCGLKVEHVMNITDVDDKTIRGSQKESLDLQQFTQRYELLFHEDMRTLNNKKPVLEPHATHEIPAMLKLIEKLIGKGHAYVKDGSVYYRISSFSSYGALSKKDLAGNIIGARVDVDEYEKEEGADFVLWKRAKADEPSWDSPWGNGRPGWHIECSAMSMKYLGDTIDIHTGGEDLVFPHHENEVAQSEGATGRPFVRYWMHCKHLLVDGEKMSKSKGNFYTLRDLLKRKMDPMAIRYVLLSVHYRQQLNFTFDAVKEGQEAIRKMDECFSLCTSQIALNQLKVSQILEGFLKPYEQQIAEALSDDLNVAKSFALLHEAVTVLNKRLSDEKEREDAACQGLLFFKKMDDLFGFDISAGGEVPRAMIEILQERSKVRSQADFKSNRELQATSDLLRKDMDDAGWVVKDSRPGHPSTVRKKRRAWDF